MNQSLSIELNTVHLWQANLADFFPKYEDYLALLNKEEIDRANRFHFEEHRRCFVVARAILKKILHLYTHQKEQDIKFAVTSFGKPYLENNFTHLQFNLSHSHGIAVYAITLDAEIGIDIEIIQDNFNEEIARRFFSAQDNLQLASLIDSDKKSAFYQIWAGKEAVLKALGEGIYSPLNNFSIDLSKKIQTIVLNNHCFYLEMTEFHPHYRSAFATEQSVRMVHYFKWTPEGYIVKK